jgi:hypothetical protein
MPSAHGILDLGSLRRPDGDHAYRERAVDDGTRSSGRGGGRRPACRASRRPHGLRSQPELCQGRASREQSDCGLQTPGERIERLGVSPKERGFSVARMTGLEPATSGVTGRCSNQLSYIPKAVFVAPCVNLPSSALWYIQHLDVRWPGFHSIRHSPVLQGIALTSPRTART